MSSWWNTRLTSEFGTRRHLVDLALIAIRRLTRGTVSINRMRRYAITSLCIAPVPVDLPVSFILPGPGDDLGDYLALGEDTLQRAQSRREEGEHILLGRGEGGVAFFAWFRIRRQTNGPDAVHIYKCFTTPEWRGKGVYKAGLRFILNWAADAGVSRASIDVAEGNLPSIRAIERCGFALQGRFVIATLFGRKMVVMPSRLRAYGPCL